MAVALCGSCGALIGSGRSSLSSSAASAFGTLSPAEVLNAQGACRVGTSSVGLTVYAGKAKPGKEEEPKKSKQSLFSAFTDAIDFSSVRSESDAELLEDARAATKSGEKMSREQYGALRRKIGGTYRDFFKDFVEVDGEYVDEGWVDKNCRVCRKNTSGAPRTVDKLGRYAHVACLESQKSGNFFTRLFGK